MQLDYARQEGAIDWDVVRNCDVVQVGIGSGQTITKTLARTGIRRLSIIDPDFVEPRNVTSQGFTYDDARCGRPKVEALARDCKAIDPELDIVSIQADFVAMADAEVKALITPKTVLLMTTDCHHAQARGALTSLVCGIPVILASLYREGRAGEIVFSYPGRTLACYRCIAASRYEHVARGKGNGTGSAAGSLPFAAQIVDALVGHLTIAIAHKWHGAENNRFAKWVDVLGQRNFIQTRMDPDYRLGNEDIFGAALGHGDQVFAFDSIWQSGLPEVKPNCPDCHGKGATDMNRQAESTELEKRECGCLVQRGAAHDWMACSRIW
jgi:hypothetical protein